MKDFSIGKASSNKEISSSHKKISNFTKKKIEYNKFMAQIAKSDFANSPVAVERELVLISELKALAQNENWQVELDWINERESELQQLKEDKKPSAYYVPLNIDAIPNPKEAIKEKWNALVESFTLEGGALEPNALKLFSLLKNGSDDIYHVSNIFSKCREDDGQFNPQKVEAVEMMLGFGINTARISEFIDTFSIYDEELGHDVVDFSSISEVGNFMSLGVEDVPAVKMAQYLNADFADKSSVKTSLVKLYKTQIDMDTIFKILDKLSVVNPNTGKIEISSKSVASIAKVKSVLNSTRRNETAERNNPINKLGENVVEFENIKIVTKDGVVTYSTPVEGENYEALKEKYDELIASLENDMILEFASKYKTNFGEIDTKYVRVLSFLRDAGIVYNGLFNMMETAIKEDGRIDVDKLDTIKTIKKSGALSDDIPMLLDACNKDEDGNYSQKDIKNICDLTSCVIRGKDVCSLLPIVGDNEAVKELLQDYSKYFSHADNLMDIIPLLQDTNGNLGENEIEVFDDLAFAFFSNPKNAEKTTSFIETATELFSKAHSSDGKFTDDAAGICAIMSQANEPMGNIMVALENCTNNNGDIDKNLAQIVWDMYIQNASLDETISMLNVCKSDNGDVNQDKAGMIISLFDAKFSKDKIAELVQH